MSRLLPSLALLAALAAPASRRGDPRPRAGGRQAARPASPCRCCRSRTASPPPGARPAARTCRRPLGLGDEPPRRDVRRRRARPGGQRRPPRPSPAAPRPRACSRSSSTRAGRTRGTCGSRGPTTLAGRVVDERGGPVVGATVTLWPGGGQGPFDVTAGSGVPQSATTRPDGTFRFEAAAPEGEPPSGRGPRLRHPGAAARPGGGPRPSADARPRPGPAGDGHARRSTDARRPAPSSASRAGRRRPAGWRRGPTGRSCSRARRARPARWSRTAGTAAVRRSSLAAGRHRARGDRPRPDRVARGTRRRRREREAPRRHPPRRPRPRGRPRSWPARARTGATRSAACPRGPTGSRPRTSASSRGRAP